MNMPSNDSDNTSIGAGHPKQGLFRRIYSALSSVKLALTLLIIILACCIVGVTVYRGAQAGAMIFGTIWFNALLVLLVINTAFCFFPRMWGRKLTLLSFGMILFHMSFVVILMGIVYNSLFYFRGLIRLTEGEALRSSAPESYDSIDKGRFFDFAQLKGETRLIKMHKGYLIGGADKRAAYEIAVGEKDNGKQGIIYITHKLDHNGFQYFNDREGYSLLVVLYDKAGKELYGAHVPLQSFQMKDESYLYATGTKQGPSSFVFPQSPLDPLFDIKAVYVPSKLKERDGEVSFQAWKFSLKGEMPVQKPAAEGKRRIGERFALGDHAIAATEVRYWVIMWVRYEPGKPIVLTSLWAGFAGTILTFIGRMRRGRGAAAGE